MAKMEIIKSNKELEFAIFCIENVAHFLGKDGLQVYRLLTEDSDILKGYV